MTQIMFLNKFILLLLLILVNCNKLDIPIYYPNLMTAGSNHSCMIKRIRGSLVCWGQNTFGQCDVPQGAVIHVTSVRAGQEFTCAVTDMQKLQCFGQNQHQQIEIEEEALSNIMTFSLSETQMCTVNRIESEGQKSSNKAVGQVNCFGDNKQGVVDVPQVLQRGTNSVWAGLNHACISKNSKIYCWGEQVRGFSKPFQDQVNIRMMKIINMIQAITFDFKIIGYDFDGKMNVSNLNMISVFKTSNIIYLDIHLKNLDGKQYENVCIVTNSRKLKCGDSKHYTSEYKVPKLFTTETISVGVGEQHVCALSLSGIVKCWNINSYNQFAKSTSANQVNQLDTPNTLFQNQTSISIGFNHKCSIKNVGQLTCKGSNSQAQLDRPTQFQDTLYEVRSVSAGSKHTCIRSISRLIYCFGSSRDNITDTPKMHAQLLDSNNRHACIINVHYELLCWGWNKYGQNQSYTGQRGGRERDEDKDDYDWDRVKSHVEEDKIRGKVVRGDVADIWRGINKIQGMHKDYYSNEGKLIENGDVNKQKTSNYESSFVDIKDVQKSQKSDNYLNKIIDQIGNDDLEQIYFVQVKTGGAHTCQILYTQIYEKQSNTPLDDLLQQKYDLEKQPEYNYLMCSGLNLNGQTDVPLKSNFMILSISAGQKHSCAISKTNYINCWGRRLYRESINTNKIQDLNLKQEFDVNQEIEKHNQILLKLFENQQREDFNQDKISQEQNIDFAESNNFNSIQDKDLFKNYRNLTVEANQFDHNFLFDQFTKLNKTDPVINIQTGRYHTCVYTKLNQIFCQGRNDSSQLNIPLELTQRNIWELVVSWNSTCLVSDDGRQGCWGEKADTIHISQTEADN